jgi:hypothetical protein
VDISRGAIVDVVGNRTGDPCWLGKAHPHVQPRSIKSTRAWPR